MENIDEALLKGTGFNPFASASLAPSIQELIAPAQAAAQPPAQQAPAADAGGLTWEGHTVDPTAFNNVYQQLQAQHNAVSSTADGSKYYGGAAWDEMDVLRDMALSLAASGISDVRQLGEGEVPFYEQAVVQQNGKYYLAPEGESVSMGRQLTPEEAEKVVEGRYGQLVLPVTRKGIINTQTGQQVLSGYGERTQGNTFGGTYTGKGNTGYNVAFQDDGTPVFYTHGASSSDVGKFAPLLALGGMLLPGVGSALASGITSATGIGGLGASMLSQGLINGGISSLLGGDFGKGALLGAAGAGVAPLVGAGVSSLGIESPLVNSALTGAGNAGIRSLLQGGDVGKSALTGALTGGLGNVAQGVDSPVLRTGINAIPQLVQSGGKVSPLQLLSMAQGSGIL